MKYLIFSMILLSGCATILSEYNQGCMDGIDAVMRPHGKIAFDEVTGCQRLEEGHKKNLQRSP